MATIDIGKLTFTHKGDYASGTAYVLNDVVYYNGSAYIAKQSTTGNVPTNTTYWSTFSAGSGGIWNSGLSIGSAGQVVKVNSGASALEFGDASAGGLEHIATTVVSGSNVGYATFNNCFSADYDVYRCQWSNFYNESQANQRLHSYLLNTGGSHLGAGQYETVHNLGYANAGGDGEGSGRDWGINYIMHTNGECHTGVAACWHIDIFNPRDASNRTTWIGSSFYHNGTYHYVQNYAGCLANSVEVFGINFTVTGGAIKADSTFSVYGYKKS